MRENENNSNCPADLPTICTERHWAIYWLIIVFSVVLVSSRVMVAANHQGDGYSPFFSANDRSRWCTVRSLGDEGKWEIDGVISDPNSAIYWDTIDKVRHLDPNGQMRSYSSKPALYPAMLAGLYRVIKQVTGWNLTDDTFFVARLMLLIVHVVPWLVFLMLMARMLDRIPVRDWTRYYVLACAGFGTFLTTFVISINNHLPAAICVMIALYCLFEILFEPQVLNSDGQYVRRKRNAQTWLYFVAGVFATFAAANELPALSFLGLAWLLCLTRSLTGTLAFSLAAAAVVGCFFWVNYLAHDDWRPPYLHRDDGQVLATVSGDFARNLNDGILPSEILQAAEIQSLELKSPFVEPGQWPKTPKNIQRWVVRDREGPLQFALTCVDGTSDFQIREWSNWYDYPGSYWLSGNDEKKSEVDRGQASRELYAFHILFGHHGIFSLTPIWLLSFPGMIALLFHRYLHLRWIGFLGIILSIVVIGFYLMRPEIDRNYGGVTSGLRWLFWLVPIWLFSMLPVVDWLARTRSGRAVCLILLVASALSAAYSMNNPWVHPWLYEIWQFSGLPR